MGEWVDVEMPDIVVVEGVYALRPQLRSLFDVAVVVDTDEPARPTRQIDRGENTDECIRRWAAAGKYYFMHHSPMDHADLTIRGN
jgi:uridine kinase